MKLQICICARVYLKLSVSSQLFDACIIFSNLFCSESKVRLYSNVNKDLRALRHIHYVGITVIRLAISAGESIEKLQDLSRFWVIAQNKCSQSG